MRRILIALIFCLGLVMQSNAQEVYKEIMKISRKALQDPTKSEEVKKIHVFKMDALNYLAMKCITETPDSSVTFIDRQAYAMYEFVNLYVKRIGQAKNKKEKNETAEMFKEASLESPMFFDMDKSVVESYLNTERFITHFSLDTNWIKALAYIRKKL